VICSLLASFDISACGSNVVIEVYILFNCQVMCISISLQRSSASVLINDDYDDHDTMVQ